MPTYQYLCDGCDYTFEEFQSIMDEKLKKCPKCGKLKLHRLIGKGGGLIFKGAGFFETDYKRKDSGKGDVCPEDSSKACSSCPASAEKK